MPNDGADWSGANLCTESWLLSNTAIACVKVVGSAKRKWTSDDADAGNDINFDYVDYNISTQFGNTADSTNV